MLSLTILLSVLLLILNVKRGCSEGDNIVKTPYGTYKGHVIKSRGGRDIIAFKGIPYAQPPIGPLRFKLPERLEPKEEEVDANREIECFKKTKRSGQTPSDNQSKTVYIGSEDCLHLNIFTPKIKTTEKLPVLFWIHGGGFFSGSGREERCGPRYFLDQNRDMIMVTINYRLHIFGFLSANDDNLPGNLGLKDQTMALKWVKENIELFGGDPNSITIGGTSAGAVSVSYHLNSKASKGLFNRAISQSGTAHTTWSRLSTKQAREVASNITSYLGCSDNSEALLKCLQDLPAEKLVDSLDIAKATYNTPMLPVVEKDSPTAFMTKDSIATGSGVPWLTGLNSEEGVVFYNILAMQDPKFFNLSFLKDNYKKMFPKLLRYGPREDEDAISGDLVDFYFPDKDFTRPDTDKNFVHLLSDLLFNQAVIQSAREYKGNLFMYRFSYRGNVTLSKLRPRGLENGVGHGDELLYLFNTNFGMPSDLKGKDLDYSHMLLDIWYHFIVHGNPTPVTHEWKESEKGIKFMDFTNEGLTMMSNMFPQRIQFLDQLEEKYKLQPEY